MNNLVFECISTHRELRGKKKKRRGKEYWFAEGNEEVLFLKFSSGLGCRGYLKYYKVSVTEEVNH